MILVDGRDESLVPAYDRGLTYGDGVFRTLPMRKGRALQWRWQYAKLAADCHALTITPPDEADLVRDIGILAAACPDCVLKITVTRGSGGRGYAMPQSVAPRRIVMGYPLPDFPQTHVSRGITVRYCTLRLAAQPRLAGVKHLNRLENVLARAEWSDPAIEEGLLLDADDHVIGGTRSNIFIVERGTLVTPRLSHCGVAGVTRDRVMESALSRGMFCVVETVDRKRLESADEIFLVNSLIDAWPVARLEHHAWKTFPVTQLVRKWLHASSN